MKKKVLIIVLIVVLVIAIITTACVLVVKSILKSNVDSSSTIKLDNKEKVNIVQSANKTVEYENYDNGLVSLEIPKGWKVEVAPTDYIHYTFKVSNPEDANYMFLFDLKQEGFLKTEKARTTYKNLYPDAVFSKLSPIDPQTTEAFYKVWNDNAKLANEIDLKSDFFPMFEGFTVLENMGKSNLGGDILRATFKRGDTSMQGLFTSTVMSSGEYKISENIFNIFGPQVDVAPLNVYNIIFMTAPDEEFINWQPVMDHCISTVQFSETFLRGFNSEEATLVSTIQANQKVYDSISDMIMDSWEKRNNSYDIISQKQSDSTLGYERVYDTETGDIYKAYNGFTDDYSGERYQPITDNMYTQSISGYIEK